MKSPKSFLTRTVYVSFFVALAIFFFKSSDTAQTKPLDLNCPPPTVQKGNQCVLEEDVVLDETLVLTSNTKLNCQDHKITPTSPGIENDGLVPRVPSVPEEGILLDGATGVKIQNCVMENFDFGIVIQNEKMTTDDPAELALQRNKILANTITSLYQGVTVINADNNLISKNAIAFHSGGGVGVSVLEDSDSNQIKDNMVTGSQKPRVDAPVFPGGPDDDWWFGEGIGLVSFSLDSTAKAMDNLVEGNTVQTRGTAGEAGIVVYDLQQGTVVRGNILKKASVGVFVGQIFNSGSTDRSFWPTNVSVEDNTLTGPFNNAGLVFSSAVTPMASRNSITGYNNFGIFLRGPGFETAVVTRNSVSNNRGLGALTFARLSASTDNIPGSCADAHPQIYLNDFTGTGAKIGTRQGYNCNTELSFEDQGNYWDRLCTDSNGFREFGEAGADSPAANIVDSNPYGELVGIIVTNFGSCNMDSKTCNGNPAIGCATDANCIVYTERPEPPPPLTCPEQGL